MNRGVSVWNYVRVGKKGRCCKLSIGNNGSQALLMIVKGREEHHPEGNFYLHRTKAAERYVRRLGRIREEL
jgi:hypothetical protein